MTNSWKSLLILGLLLTAAARPEMTAAPPSAAAATDREQYPAGVAWFGTWEGALAEATRTGKPILLLSAAPQCRGVPGIW